MTRASLVVKWHCTWHWSVLVAPHQAASSVLRRSIYRSTHRTDAPICVSSGGEPFAVAVGESVIGVADDFKFADA